MKNFNKIIAAILLSGSVLTGCSDDFLERSPSESTITKDQVEEISKQDPNITKTLVTGLYSFMSQAGVGGDIDSHEDFGQKGNDIISDILSCDVAYKMAFGRYRNIANLQATQDYTFTTPNYMFWRYYYRVIAQANSIIQIYGGNTTIPSKSEEKLLMAQAKAMRAYSYLYLMVYYTKEYNPGEKILVYYDKPETKAKGQVETKVIMDSVIKDLKDALSLFGDNNSRVNKSVINPNVARGLLAYAYAQMGQYNEVVPLTEKIINSNEFTLKSKEGLYSGMNDVASERGWMWALDIIGDMKFGLQSFWGQMDIYSYSYPAFGGHKKMDDALMAQMNEKDLRRGQFTASDKVIKGFPANIPYKKFFAKERVLRGAKKIIDADVVYMRVAEFYLLRAEALAKMGNDAGAIEALKPLLKERYNSEDDYKYITSKSGKELQDEIYLQTRLELWGEGKSYFAMKRNKAKVVRGKNHSFLSGQSFQYNDPRLTLEVPLDEIENNPNVKKAK